MKVIEISNIERHLQYLLKRYTDCKSRPNGHSYLEKYKADYDKALLVYKKINEKSVKTKDEGSFGLAFFIPVETLEEYFELYKLLKLIPESEIHILQPDSISICEKTYDFYQVE